MTKFLLLLLILFIQTFRVSAQEPAICEKWLTSEPEKLIEWNNHQAEESARPYLNKMNQQEIEALTDYQVSEYDLINADLRNHLHSTSAYRKTIDAMDSAFSKTENLPIGLTLYRSEYFPPERIIQAPGEKGFLEGFTSTSHKELSPISYGSTVASIAHVGDSIPVVVGRKIVIRGEGVKGIHLDSITNNLESISFSQENEILLPRGLRYEVTEVVESPAKFSLMSPTKAGIRRFKYIQQTIEVWAP